MSTRPTSSGGRADIPSFLVLLVDLDFSALGSVGAQSLFSVLDALLIFINSFLLLHRANRIAVVLVVHPTPIVVYPADGEIEEALGSLSDGFPRHEEDHHIMQRIREAMVNAVHSAASPSDETGPTPISAAFTRALCLINRWNRPPQVSDVSLTESDPMEISDLPGKEQLPPAAGRVFILFSGTDQQAHYVPLMNCNFSSQRMAVVVDACILAKQDSTFLQQITHLNNGLYLRPKLCQQGQYDSLLSYLLPVFLPDAATRDQLALPVQNMVDFGATCFKTGKIIQIGFTCSVCLSTFATRKFVCPTCGSRPKIKTRA